MKAFKTVLVILVLGGLIIAMFGCGAPSTNGTAESQIATVKRGDLTLDITAAGNLALAHTEDLVVELFYGQSGTGTKGTIGEVLVEEGDSVKEGQVLITIDKDEWNDQLSDLKDQVTTEERALVQAQYNLLSVQQTLAGLQDTAAKQKALLSAQIEVDTARKNLNAGFTAMDDQAASAALNKARVWYEYLQRQSTTSATLVDWTLLLQNAKDTLDAAQTNYDMALSGYNSQDMAIKKKQVEVAQLNLAILQKDLADVPQDIALQEKQVEMAEGKVDDAEKALADAQNKLAEAQSKSPEIKAPFDGFITAVNVKGGDEVLNGTVAATIADPNKFEADILVSEMDISQVKLSGEATVSADAMSGIILPAKVTHIAPSATIQSGVVNYNVKVELEALKAISQNQTTPGTANATAGTLSPMLQRAVDSGRMTQEQAEEIAKNGPPEDFTPPEGFTPPEDFILPEGMEFPAISGSQTKSQLPSTTSQNFQLREGLTVTVSIIVASRTNVLLVPNGAVTTEGLQSYVQVVSASGATEKRAVKTGISDWQYTEITDGLTEGEQVSVTLTTSSTSESTGQGGMGFFGPGR
jgi:multidrug efflux pump subunit AcrA (membrane-fusion protein)